MKYYFFKKNKLGKKLNSIDADKVYIRETNDQKPCLIYRYGVTEMTGIFKWLFGTFHSESVKDKILVVPEDTVKIEYNVDI